MSVSRSQRMKNMFPEPKKADLVTDDPVAQILLKDEMKDSPLEVIEVALDDIVKTEGTINKHPINSDPLLVKSDSKLSSNEKKVKKEKKVVSKPILPVSGVFSNEVETETPTLKESKVFIGCRVSKEMKNALEDMSKDFAYLARKKYGLKIKDDISSIQRAFLLLGMSCFTEKLRQKTLQDYDSESSMQDEVSQQLLALMRMNKVEIDDLDF